MEYQYLAGVVITLLFLGLFSCMELVFVSTHRLQIALQSKLGTWKGRILSRFLQKPDQFTGTTLIGNTISLVAYGILMSYLLVSMTGSLLPDEISSPLTVLFVQVLLATVLVLVLAVYVPQSLFMRKPNLLLTILTLPFALVYYLIYPLVWLIGGLANIFVTKILKLEYPEDKPVFRITDLNRFIQNSLQAEGDVAESDINTEIFDNAVEFRSIRIRDCMVPRTDIVAVELSDSIEDLKNVFTESGHSKIVIYRDNIDDVVGYCHHLELFKKPRTIQEILTPIIIVPESALANELLVQFISERKSLALVVDEFGGTGGIVSMEDVIEQIFGEIEDEYDNDDLVEEQISEQEFLFSARLEVEYLNEKYDWNLPQGDYETLGGLILSLTESIPREGQSMVFGPYTFTVESKQENRIDTVKLTVSFPTIPE